MRRTEDDLAANLMARFQYARANAWPQPARWLRHSVQLHGRRRTRWLRDRDSARRRCGNPPEHGARRVGGPIRPGSRSDGRLPHRVAEAEIVKERIRTGGLATSFAQA